MWCTGGIYRCWASFERALEVGHPGVEINISRNMGFESLASRAGHGRVCDLECGLILEFRNTGPWRG